MHTITTADRIWNAFRQERMTRADITGDHLRALISTLPICRDSVLNGKNVEAIRSIPAPRMTWADTVVGVIVETRVDPALEYVIRNVIDTTGIKVHAFHGNKNASLFESGFLKELTESKQLTTTNLGADFLPAIAYNALFLNTDFWNNVAGRKKILVFQTDSLCCPGSNYVLN